MENKGKAYKGSSLVQWSKVLSTDVAMGPLWDVKEGPGVSNKAKVFRVGSNLHFGWENHAYAILQSLYEQARVR